ncbi:NAD(P)H-hydrate dehydratase [Microbacterium lacus]|uniref:ADP-dependent NAD(P)H-hydrate dehydratase n=1 Tax=Microbacterium lacus TaxID=415217 RepID=UPI00384BE800
MVEVVTWSSADVARVLRMPTDGDDKYSRGVVGLRTGSTEYPGAAVLGVEAAWRTGVGMVRYLGPSRDLVLARRPETVTADGRVHAWVIGSGTDPSTRSRAETGALRAILARTEPVIVDAGALDLALGASAPVIVTPHDREHARLREGLHLSGAPEDRTAAAVETASALDAVVLLKGSSTLVATPDGLVLRVDAGVPWLATAGTGDVLAGAIGALVAAAGAGNAPADAASLAAHAASGAWLHARAGAIASAAYGSAGGPITAMDVAEALPRAVGEVLAER